MAYTVCGVDDELSEQLVEFIELGVLVLECWYERVWFVTVH